MIKGVDVSKHNGPINWGKVKKDGIKFAILRGGYSTTYVDSQFQNNIKGCIKNNIPVGIYWFSYATNVAGAIKEADKCLSVIKKYKEYIKYPVFYDLEYDTIRYAKTKGVIINKELASAMTEAFLNRIKSQGYNVGIYTNLDFSRNYFTSKILCKYDVWIAQYNSKCTYTGEYALWQYSENGKVDGINGLIDMNYCYKDYTKEKFNENVKELQSILNKCYKCNLEEDGLYGPLTQKAINNHYLKKGSKNDHVAWLQKSLKKLKYNISVDGSFGVETETVLKKFQRRNNLKVDKMAGLQTHTKIINLL